MAEKAQKAGKATRLLALLLPAVALIGPFIVPRTSHTHDITPFYLGLLLLLCAWYFFTVRPKGILGCARIYCVFLFVMLAYACLSLLWVKNAGQSAVALYYQVTGAMSAILVAASIGDRGGLYRLLDVLAVCWAAVVLLGIYEIFTGHFIFSPRNPEIGLLNVHRLFFPYTVFGNTNDYATYVTLFMPFAAYDILIRLRGFKGFLVSGILCAAALFTIDNADARACVLGFAVIFVAFVLFMLFSRPLRRYAPPLLAAGAAFLVGAAVYLTRSGALARMLKLLSMSDHSVAKRYELTLAAFRLLAASHFMGVGVGNSVPLVPYYSPITAPLNLHNTTLQILAEYGIIIFVLFAAALIGLAVKFFAGRAVARRDAVLAGLCFSTVCAYPVIGIASSDMTHLIPVWLIWGIWFVSLQVLYPGGGAALHGVFRRTRK